MIMWKLHAKRPYMEGKKMKRYVNEFAADVKKHYPRNLLDPFVDRILRVYHAGLITTMEAMRMLCKLTEEE